MKTTEEVLGHHLKTFAEGDMDGILADYDDSSVVITPEETYRGLDEIPTFFEELFTDFGQEGAYADIDLQTIEGDIAFITWHGETPDNVYEFCTDTFVVEDGVITTQTFAGKIESK
ncbi:nuclear transport factor 2 family protein [Haloferax sp. MBLA0076]|uniref:Nuclear transport factor 2 family protein n=1 Tax=Haloferax litoreum TaxID=2666140 RepID=A0A6A8GIG0_9EURY|nr:MULTISPECIES: nuclear transport factor 2 family protein [Haloferax]KAB1193000.1 nuclear transport factor 2 family protein [Haloferax sp. CBA1148]MRX21490.1 nuclear transport factor 2 family protein [Haloferax litoreum]